MNTQNNSSAVGTLEHVAFVPHTGQDPAMLAMYERAGYYKVDWPEKKPVAHYDPLAALFFAVLAWVWCGPAVWLRARSFRRVWVVGAFLGACCLVTVANALTSHNLGEADTSTGNSTPNHGVGTIQVNSVIGGTLTYGYSTSPSGDNVYAWITQSTGLGNTGTEIAGDFGGAGAVSGTGTLPVTAGQWIALVVQTGDMAGGVDRFYAYYHVGFTGVPPPTYGIDFNVPANTGTRPQVYQVVNGVGAVIQTYTSAPGDPSAVLHITGLTTADSLYLQAVLTAVDKVPDPANPGGYMDGIPYVVGTAQVAGGIPSTTPGLGSSAGGTLPAAGVPVNLNAPTVPTVPTPAPTPAATAAAPTPASTVAPHAPIITPFDGTATANTSGASGGDVAKAANANTDAINAAVAASQVNTNGVITAINSEAVAAHDASTATIGAVNKASADATTASNNIVGALDKLRSQENANDNPADPSAPGLTNPSAQTAAWQPGTYNPGSVIAAHLPTAPTLDTSLGSVHSVNIHLVFPKLDGSTLVTVDKTVDFGSDPYATPIAIFRGICLVILTLSFFLLTFWTIRGAFVSK